METRLVLKVNLTVEATNKSAAKALATAYAEKLNVGASTHELLGDFSLQVDAVQISEIKPRKPKDA